MDSAFPSVAMLCEHVFTGERPILLVIHQRFWWQLLCGADDHTGRPHRAHVHHAAQRALGLEFEGIPLGFEASRASATSAWVVTPSAEGDVSDSDAAAFVAALQARRGKHA
ncbi:MAG: hypothetical protein IPH44_03265 [Myxococcales bacterium]|nr:hypothetical protein [Myxococcales bacterium]